MSAEAPENTAREAATIRHEAANTRQAAAINSHEVLCIRCEAEDT